MTGRHISRRGGFTMVELLVVIAIIAILAAIVLVAGGRVLSGGKKTATQDVLHMLDTSLEAYIAAKDGLPTAALFTTVDAAGATSKLVPVADARDGGNLPDADPARSTNPDANLINSGGLYLLQASEVPSAKTHIDGIPQRFLKQARILGSTTSATERQILTPVDAWGHAIRFVLPVFDGVQKADVTQSPGTGVSLDSPQFPQRKPSQAWAVPTIRRNNASGPGLADSDGGKCIGKRPYFYSCGEDGDPSTTEDNVYTTIPTFTKN
jgi:hypothetical protein